MSTKRWCREIETLVGPHGWYLHRQNKHLIFRGPEGQQVTVSATPSDKRRALMNVKQVFRRYGCDL